VGNAGSARVARALGFRYEGVLRRALANSFGREDGWVAGLLPGDARMPQPWPVLTD
jgi:RimJ/RimL family protein N-acetyltransferase